MRYSTGQANRLGNRASNQDRCLVVERDDAVLLAVADGMGGHARGDLAAQTFVDTLGRLFRAYQGLDDPMQFLRNCFREAHRMIQQVGQSQTPPIEPLTTAVACLIQDGAAMWAHVGDSRAYLLRGGKVAIRTRDHTRVADMVAAGLLTEQQARLHPLRNQVSLCLGGTPQPPPVTFGPRVFLNPGDVLLLCSDGLWAAVSEKSMIAMLETGELDAAVDELATLAEQKSYPQSDNVSGVALRWESGREGKARAGGLSSTAAPEEDDPIDRAIADIHRAYAEYESEMQQK